MPTSDTRMKPLMIKQDCNHFMKVKIASKHIHINCSMLVPLILSSLCSVQCTLHCMIFHSHLPTVVLLLIPVHQLLHFIWAREHQHWSRKIGTMLTSQMSNVSSSFKQVNRFLCVEETAWVYRPSLSAKCYSNKWWLLWCGMCK